MLRLRLMGRYMSSGFTSDSRHRPKLYKDAPKNRLEPKIPSKEADTQTAMSRCLPGP